MTKWGWAAALVAAGCGGSGAPAAPADVATPARGPEAVVVVEPTGAFAPLEPEGDPPPPRSAAALRLVRDTWQRLDQTVNTCPDHYDYHPDGGMRIFACHLFSLVPYAQFRKQAGMPIFVSGPHSPAALALDSAHEFGHYSPAFVRWLGEHAVPGADEPGFRRATQPLYDQYVKPLATTFYVTYQKARAEPDCFEREERKFRRLLKARKLPRDYYEKYFYFMNPLFCGNPDGGFDYFHKRGFDGGHDGNVVKTCVGFWLRRSLDGTADDFHRGLEKLLRAYDPAVLERGGRRR